MYSFIYFFSCQLSPWCWECTQKYQQCQKDQDTSISQGLDPLPRLSIQGYWPEQAGKWVDFKI